MTWEPTPNLSEDLIRDFEEAFWKACKSGDAVFLAEALQYGGATAANLVNSEGRAPLHFAAALNNGTLCQQLIDAGAPPAALAAAAPSCMMIMRLAPAAHACGYGPAGCQACTYAHMLVWWSPAQARAYQGATHAGLAGDR